jgi:UDP-2,4-diacetamido-2,4,6-trideoxy-beta-L-altropyranose hydrolase
MVKPDLFFRVDGSSAIGLGHLIRSLALAQMIDSLFNIHFYCTEAPVSFISELGRLKYNFNKINNEYDLIENIKQGDVVVIDHYTIGIKIHKLIREKGVKLVCIDDIHDKAFDVDLIINHAPGVDPANYKAMPYTKFALGPQFALLRPEFLKSASTNLIRKSNRKLLICFGGSDFNNLTCKTVELLKSNSFFEEIIVVTGQVFSFRDQLQKLISLDCRIKWFENQTASQLLALMNVCQYALAPSSSIAFEILAAGCTWLGGYYIENQKYIYEGFKKINAFVDLGDLNNIDGNVFTESYLIQSQIFNKKTLIDGKSKLRILEYFKPYVNSTTN